MKKNQGSNCQHLLDHRQSKRVPCPVLTVASWPAYSFLRRQIRWSGMLISWRIFHICCDSHSQRLWCSQRSRSGCFSGTLLLFQWPNRSWQFDLCSSAFSKYSLNIWKFMVHVLLKPGLENFKQYFAHVWDECNGVVVEHSLALPLFETGMKTDLFPSCGHCWVFQICWHIECITFTASSFRIWNSSTGIPSSPLALFNKAT